MKEYPSIPQSIGQKFREIPQAFVFDKLDGSSMRAEWSMKRGWYKFGRRNGLVDDSNQALTEAPGLFMERMGDAIERIAWDHRWLHLIVFFEFWSPNSLAGRHVKEPHNVSLFDIDFNKRGIVDPKTFRELFEDKVEMARYLGRYNWTRGFVQDVYHDRIPGVTFEGVVGKAGEKHKLVRAKAKTKAWLDAVKSQYGEQAEKIINS